MTNTLTKRIITASIIAPIFILAAYQLPVLYFQLLLGFIALLAGAEWLKLAQLNKIYQKITFGILLLFGIAVSLYAVLLVNFWHILPILLIAVIFWLINLVLLFTFPKGKSIWYGWWGLRALNGVFFLVPMLVCLILLHRDSLNLFMLLLAVVWAADIGAYFTGKAYGKAKLAPQISPNKTIEGAFGGFVLSALVMMLFLSSMGKSFSLLQLLYVLLIVGFSIVGDLYQSLLKRASNLKDSGNILPGHGGILDRIDALAAATPIFLIVIFTL